MGKVHRLRYISLPYQALEVGDCHLTNILAWESIVRAFEGNVASGQATLGSVFSMNVPLTLLTCGPIELESKGQF